MKDELTFTGNTLKETMDNSITLALSIDNPIIVINETGFWYKGQLIEDNNEVYALFKEFLKDSTRLKENDTAHPVDENGYPLFEGVLNLCSDKSWDDIYHDYSTEQYPAFGGPFTESISFIDWLKQNYKAPERTE